ncbi:neutral alpha-glucosidase AB-like [Centruroides vittatus]|uniref:neutral alpha-glucosidase AB-like n=1 Tax=Centruroides vittatus TaxID=120091 RepID=UPI00350FAF9C
MATCMGTTVPFLILIITFLSLVTSVDRSNFKTCDQSGFCRRNRNLTPGQSPYYLQMNTIKTTASKIEGNIVNGKNGVEFKFQLSALVSNMLHIKINELKPLRPRFEPKEALIGEPPETNLQITNQDSEGITATFGNNKAVVTANPFRIDVYTNDQLVISVNPRGLMRFEHHRLKDQGKQVKNEGEESENNVEQPPQEEETPDAWWEETFKGKTDSKPHGPSSVGMDFSFVGFEHVYGIPEHADKFSLKTTVGSTDPFRLYNLDVAEYELNNPMALYGSIPFMVAHSEAQTVGLLWLNAAETWVDVVSTSKQSVVSSIVDFVKGNSQMPQTSTHWFSESGIIDVYLLLGPHPKNVVRQYARLTGTTPLPAYFSLAYHQCRWNYKDQDDVRNVDSGFDENDIPYDVIWLDVDHTDGRRYFTWDPYNFPTPEIMLNNVTAKGRKMVTLVDPHIKRDSGYYVHKEASDYGYYVKNKDGNDYEGWCWPGSSGYLDFLNPTVRDWWAEKFLLEQYKGSTLSLYTWNDMNEPSVFSEPEITMPKDCKHFGGWEHRDVHNIYGMLMVMGTYKGHLMRSKGQQRPFILTRSFFAGSQRFGAAWTGDNDADWGHLRITVPMLLSMSITGMSFCGADVGGFYRNPSAELTLRWYQAGAFQPFFRSHSHHDTRRREPWLFDQEIKMLIREAIRKRYSYLPFWYTLFYQNEQTGIPPMRPIWMEFPKEKETFDLDDEYMIGSALLVRPVLDAGVSGVNVYFPGKNEIWYDIDTYQKYDGSQQLSFPVSLSKIPVFQRGGTIIPKKERIRRSSSLSHQDPYTFVIALDKSGQSANGTLFVDEGDSFHYKEGDYLLLSLNFNKNVISSKLTEGPGKFQTKAWLERIVIIGVTSSPKSIHIDTKDGDSRDLQFTYNSETKVLVIRRPAVNIAQEWKITIKS